MWCKYNFIFRLFIPLQLIYGFTFDMVYGVFYLFFTFPKILLRNVPFILFYLQLELQFPLESFFIFDDYGDV